MAFYLAPIIGSGTAEDPFRWPVVADGGMVDGRADATKQAGTCLLECKPTPKEHQLLLAAGATYLGEDAGSDIDAARTTLLTSATRISI